MGVNTRLLWLFCAVVAFNIVQCKIITRSQEAPIETTQDHNKNTRQKRSTTTGNTTVSNRFCVQGMTKCNNSSISCVYDGKGFVMHPNLTYRVVNEPRNGSFTGLSKSVVEELTARALTAWAPHCGLHFTRRDHGPADIMISFEHGDHGDTDLFQSNSTLTAHIGFPYNYTIRFSDEDIAREYNSIGDKKTYFFRVILQVVGRALGLGFFPEQDAVMYGENKETTELHINEINCMRLFYGLEIIRRGEWGNFKHLSETDNKLLQIINEIHRVSLMFQLA